MARHGPTPLLSHLKCRQLSNAENTLMQIEHLSIDFFSFPIKRKGPLLFPSLCYLTYVACQKVSKF